MRKRLKAQIAMIEQIYDRVTNKADVGSKDKRITREGCV